jgi:uncharacterized membrane protein SirB2
MKQPKSFVSAFAESSRVELPYWVLTMALLTVRAALDFAWLDASIILIMAYVGIGACIVFVVLKVPSRQDIRRIDFIGALKNLYQAAWWPWYVWKRLTHKG